METLAILVARGTLEAPGGDSRFSGAAGVSFLREVVRIVRDRGYEVANLDATVIAEAPALAPHLESMRRSISGAIGMPFEDVSVKAKSTDGLGALGRGEGIAAQATTLLRARTANDGSQEARPRPTDRHFLLQR
jgi:2-C-methyl-D-erythritol 2,4-cyclodiphosphate synthase